MPSYLDPFSVSIVSLWAGFSSPWPWNRVKVTHFVGTSISTRGRQAFLL